MSSRRARRPPRRPRLRLRNIHPRRACAASRPRARSRPPVAPLPRDPSDFRVEWSCKSSGARRRTPPSDSRRSARARGRPTSNPRPSHRSKTRLQLARHRRVDRGGPRTRRRRSPSPSGMRRRVPPLEPTPPRDSPPSSKTRVRCAAVLVDSRRHPSATVRLLEAARALPDGEDELVVVEASDALDVGDDHEVGRPSDNKSSVRSTRRSRIPTRRRSRTCFSRPGARVDRKDVSRRAPRWRITARRRTPRTASPRGTWCWSNRRSVRSLVR